MTVIEHHPKLNPQEREEIRLQISEEFYVAMTTYSATKEQKNDSDIRPTIGG
jgi:hypothetical protein